MGEVGGVVVGGENGGGVMRVGLGSNPDPLEIDLECMEVGEEVAKEVLNCIHPTLDSEERRKDVVDYVQRLFRDYLGCEVFPYGSVPLKTYLPDGDIDLTAIHPPHVDDYFPREVLAILQEEELNKNAEYQVRDIQFIDAEVKLVKCIVQNIVVDISFNQLGGLSTLCFLEKVDQLAGKDHLFKCSILLVKSWCYYESRILGAHHGLLSTYALETLILYIFHVFHSSLTGPLAVLYRFLDFYGKFDWDKYCISLTGPVRKSTLPDIVVENLEYGENDLMLSEEFLRYCMDMFLVLSSDQTPKAFPPKHLNIVDPLKECNNLGRSVHRGNYYRIRSAFRHGSRKLGLILSSPRERVADEIKNFFANTLERHGCKRGDCMCKPVLMFGVDWSINLSCSLFDDTLFKFEDDATGVKEECTSKLSDELNNLSSLVSSQGVSESYSVGDALSQTSVGDGNYDLSHSSSQSGEEASQLRFHATELCQLSSTDNGDLKYGHSGKGDSEAYESSIDKLAAICSEGSAISSSTIEPLNPLADLTGDYDSHLRSFLYGQSFNGPPLSTRGVSYLPSTNSKFRSEKPQDTVFQSTPLRGNSFPRNNSNFVCTGSSLDVSASSTSSRVSLCNGNKRNALGTGTYIPNTNFHHKGRTLEVEKERTKSSENCCQLQRRSSMSGKPPELPEMTSSGNGTCGHHYSQSPVHEKFVEADNHVANSSNSCGLQFGSFRSFPIALSNYFHRNRSDRSGSPPQMKNPNSAQFEKHGRVEEQSFHLKNDEFPALSV